MREPGARAFGGGGHDGISTRAIRHYHRIGLLAEPARTANGYVWGVLFLFGLFASFVVRPHVIGADGSLRLRSGALLDIRIPGQDIAAVRVERRAARGKKGAVDDDGCAGLSQGGQTTVTWNSPAR